jgi:hypothetical protein
MPTRFERWMRSNDSAITARTPSKPSLRGPVARRAGPVLLARDDDERRPACAAPSPTS